MRINRQAQHSAGMAREGAVSFDTIQIDSRWRVGATVAIFWLTLAAACGGSPASSESAAQVGTVEQAGFESIYCDALRSVKKCHNKEGKKNGEWKSHGERGRNFAPTKGSCKEFCKNKCGQKFKKFTVQNCKRCLEYDPRRGCIDSVRYRKKNCKCQR